jgi:hypothetical protein
MAEFVSDCPRCGARHTTFDVLGNAVTGANGWQIISETYSVCRQCHRGTIFLLRAIENGFAKHVKDSYFGTISGSLTGNGWIRVDGYVSIKDAEAVSPPEHLPKDIESVFCEGARCFAVGCCNAAGTMFRLCVDLATKALLPDPATVGVPQPNSKQRRDLGLRLPWLFEQNLLPEGLHDLSSCIKEDGNDGAHAGNLTKEDVEDILDFTFSLLERLYTEPEKIKRAKERQVARRAQN